MSSKYHEWLVADFTQLSSKKLRSPKFKLGAYNWQFLMYPHQDQEPHTHISLYLEAVDVAAGAQQPTAMYKLYLRHWKDSNKDSISKSKEPKTFNMGWGCSAFFPRAQLTTDSGFIRRRDGALLLAVEIELPAGPAAAAGAAAGGSCHSSSSSAYPANIKNVAARQDVGGDLLALLEKPGSTSDLTIVATAGSDSGADAGGSANDEAPAAKWVKRKAAAGKGRKSGCVGSPDTRRRFDVHRAILAARCPYFATHFASGMGDSAARELDMPDTDPGALAALLRFIYGGELVVASRPQARASLALADRLLLPKAVALLREQLLASLCPSTIAADLMWAAGCGDQAGLLAELLDFAAEAADEVPQSDLQQLAAAHPGLTAQLFAASVRAAKRLKS